MYTSTVFHVRLKSVKLPINPASFLDARNPQCSKVNEANEVEMFRLDVPKDRLLVRQISGAIARRIVCEAKTGEDFFGWAAVWYDKIRLLYRIICPCS